MKKILVIDDDQVFVKTVSDSLSSFGYKITTAKDGAEGLEKIGKEKPDLVMLDLMMPNIGGMEFLRILQKDDTINKIPVLISSNFNSTSHVDEGLKFGVRGYIVKSNESLKTIGNAVESIIGKAEQ